MIHQFKITLYIATILISNTRSLSSPQCVRKIIYQAYIWESSANNEIKRSALSIRHIRAMLSFVQMNFPRQSNTRNLSFSKVLEQVRSAECRTLPDEEGERRREVAGCDMKREFRHVSGLVDDETPVVVREFQAPIRSVLLFSFVVPSRFSRDPRRSFCTFYCSLSLATIPEC